MAGPEKYQLTSIFIFYGYSALFGKDTTPVLKILIFYGVITLQLIVAVAAVRTPSISSPHVAVTMKFPAFTVAMLLISAGLESRLTWTVVGVYNSMVLGISFNYAWTALVENSQYCTKSGRFCVANELETPLKNTNTYDLV